MNPVRRVVPSRLAINESRGKRSGQALLEFAIVAFVLTLLLAGVLAMGLLLVSANVLQQAADVGAQELARHPYPATGTFSGTAGDPNDPGALLDSQLFDEAALIVDVGTDPTTLPLINRLLFPVYVFDPDTNDSNGNQGVLRYPGAVVTNDTTLAQTVLIPIVGTDANGVETIDDWLPVVEEIVPVDPTAVPPIDRNSPGPYSLDPNVGNEGQLPSLGFVALRINYPYQSAALVSYVRVRNDGSNTVVPSNEVVSEDVINRAIVADDSIDENMTRLDELGYTLATPTRNNQFDASVSRGRFGLGEVGAFAVDVRPYRKVLSAQGIYRREVLLP